MARIRAIRQVDEHHHFTLMCRDLSEVSRYAKSTIRQFRLLKAITPGCYTFIFQATREVPRRLLHPTQHHRRAYSRSPRGTCMLTELNEPLLRSTLIMPGDEFPLNDAWKSALGSNIMSS